MKKTEIQVPEWFKAGIKFNSEWINYGDNQCELKSFDVENNKCEVTVRFAPSTEYTESDWDLQHTLWAFEKSEYILTS